MVPRQSNRISRVFLLAHSRVFWKKVGFVTVQFTTTTFVHSFSINFQIDEKSGWKVAREPTASHLNRLISPGFIDLRRGKTKITTLAEEFERIFINNAANQIFGMATKTHF